MQTQRLVLATLIATAFGAGSALAQTTPATPAAPATAATPATPAAPGKSPTPAEIVEAAPTGAVGTTATVDAAAPETKADVKADAKAAKADAKAAKADAKAAKSSAKTHDKSKAASAP